jgi:hypothetical protein
VLNEEDLINIIIYMPQLYKAEGMKKLEEKLEVEEVQNLFMNI